MFRRMSIIIVSVFVAILMIYSTANSRRTSIYIDEADLATYDPIDTTLGDYYVLDFQAPQNITANELEFAFLELIVDASAIEKNGYLNGTPLLEVYALKSEFAGELDPDQFELQAMPMVRNVVLGEDRRVVIDITEVVRSYIVNPAKNHGLIFGSLTGSRDGIFDIQRNKFEQAGVAKISFFIRE
ncbi:MAG: hypothetical protein GTO29_10405 [Candidatus Latescibacteria bacterium]|nr:hypothetical protein [Candidatus Latescibacterota bacterium]NIO56569.1 hypothetical protein [Candidatus Latescibacterota bacterium]NIT39042.1 hypothetical protein [Candidatus Latescibacterota bacterium]